MKIIAVNGKRILHIAESELSTVTNENYNDFSMVKNKINELKEKQAKILYKYKQGCGLLKLPEENLKYDGKKPYIYIRK